MFFDTLQALCDEKGIAMSALLDKELKQEAGIIQQKVGRLYQVIESGLDAAGAIERINALQKQRMTLLAQANDLDVSAESAAASVDELRRVWSGINLRELQPEKMRANCAH